MAYTPDYTQAGIATWMTDAVNPGNELLAGHEPALSTISAAVSSAIGTAGLAAWTPVIVAYDGGPLSLPAAGQKANAITVGPVAAGSGATNIPVYKSGCFNVKALKYDAAVFADLPAQLSAFDNASCNITVKQPYLG